MRLRKLLLVTAMSTGLWVGLTLEPSLGAAGAPCAGCHQVQLRARHPHQPVAAGDCTACHLPVSGADHPRVKQGAFALAEPGAKLCARCHDLKLDRKYLHAPVAAGDCRACHQVHGAAHPRLLQATGKALCLTCHEDIYDLPVLHAPVRNGDCLACHEPHQADNRRLLRRPGAALCFGCHDQRLFEGLSIHQPVALGECQDCHFPHGSVNRKLLTRDFPEAFYLPFELDRYSFCFQCHNRDLATDQRTLSGTGFRNGDRNLHYVHLHIPERGRTCKTCHSPHAANQERLIMEKVPGFGSWEIPIDYTPAPEGGGCVVGCHKPKGYNRLSPEENP